VTLRRVLLSTDAGGSTGLADDDGFEEFYRATRQRVMTFLYAMCGDRAEAQDAAQEAYVRAWQRWPVIAGYDDPEAWVRTVGYRLCASRWRKARNALVAHRRHGAGPPGEPPSENTVALVRALRQLPAADREVVVLHHLRRPDGRRRGGPHRRAHRHRQGPAGARLAGLLGSDLTGEYTHA
jgi:DNA-directed RNA polymerase specialized sigma24 family protein